MTLEICTDASIRTFQNGRVFGCAGAICLNTMEEDYLICPDTTNNRSELLGIYTGIKLAEKIFKRDQIYNDIMLYSDSSFGIYGLTKWMDGWLMATDKKGVMYGSGGKPVKNQELFKMIITYLCINKLRVQFRHQAGHINYNIERKLKEANDVFFKSNGYYLKPPEIYKISYYNDMVDKRSRAMLYVDDLLPEKFPPLIHLRKPYLEMCQYAIPADWHNYVS